MNLPDKEKGWAAKFRGVHNIEITTIIGCKNMCVYCPQDKILKAYNSDIKKMTLEIFKKILSNIPKDVELYFAGLSESFLNNESSMMMRYAIEEGYNIVLYTTLVGFNDNDLEILANMKGVFGGVAFHRYDGNGYDKNDFNRKQNLFRTKILGIDPISDNDNSGKVDNPISRAGNVWDEENKIGKFSCGSTANFDNNLLLPNGDVYLCCMDFSLKHKLGNLLETHYDNLDRSEVFRLSNNEYSDIICRKCFLFRKKW
jgi:radical SAM protein with 4Fe4S-binding SPASM domain